MAKKVFLSAGHGGSDPGAAANGLKEKDVNLQMLLSCKAELERHGVTVIASRMKDENDPVAQEVAEANASGASLAVSFHNNAGGGDGFEGYYYSSDANGKRLVQIAQKYINALGQNNHGNPVKTGNQLMFVNSTKMTAVLFESAFLDSKDKEIVDTEAEQNAFGVAYAKAILEYLGIPYKAPAAPKPEAPKPPVPSNPDTLYRVQVGAYKDKANADKLVKELKAKGYDAYVRQ